MRQLGAEERHSLRQEECQEFFISLVLLGAVPD